MKKVIFLSSRYWVTNKKNINDQEPGLIITENVIEICEIKINVITKIDEEPKDLNKPIGWAYYRKGLSRFTFQTSNFLFDSSLIPLFWICPLRKVQWILNFSQFQYFFLLLL